MSGKAIILIRENNHKTVPKSIACQNYTHIFTTSKIALSKKCQAHVLNDPQFSSRFSLLAIDKIDLVEE